MTKVTSTVQKNQQNQHQKQHWLDRYGKGYHAWVKNEDGKGWSRPCGLFETRFDTDGRYHGGRADISEILTVDISTRLSAADLRQHVLLAFTLLRLHHSLLRGRAEPRTLGVEPWFSVDVPETAEAAIRDAASAIQFVDTIAKPHATTSAEPDLRDLITHSLNVARIIKPSEALARAFVLPLEPQPQTMRWRLRILFVLAHEIVDGLSVVRWLWHFVQILNLSTDQIRSDIASAVAPDAVYASLPPAQEDLYAPVAPTRARTRWFWAITIVLRYVKKPGPAALPNPLRRTAPLSAARPFEPRYAHMFDYAQTPPLNTLTARVRLSPDASARLYRLCKEAGASVGAGGFVLVAMTMMSLHEAKIKANNKPGMKSEIVDEHRPFRTSFPLNPRPFIANAATSDGLVLAFSSGLSLPFLPSRVSFEKRFKFLAQRASAQLAAYQKRDNKADFGTHAAAAARYMGIRGPGRLIASNYIDGVENMRELYQKNIETEKAEEEKEEEGEEGTSSRLPSPQGAYRTPVFDISEATCEVSSIGKVDFSAARLDLDGRDPGERGVLASVQGLMNCCRARDTEFGVATLSQDGIMQAEISFDANTIDEEKVPLFLDTMRTLLELPPAELEVKARL